jgi:hypothetical protein
MRKSILSMFAAFLLVATGCSSESTRYPVAGTVSINAVPAALTQVIFIAVDPATPTSSGGSAVTDENGNFTVTNADKKPGLMPGEYKVIFQQTLINGKPTLNGSRGKKSAMVLGETEGVPSDYSSPDKTPIRITVKRNMEPCQFEIKK